MPRRTLGPPTTISGTGFFEYFLPLMAILGDIIELHYAGQHPRLGATINNSYAESVITATIAGFEASLDQFARKLSMEEVAAAAAAASAGGGGSHNPGATMQISSIVTGLREQQQQGNRSSVSDGGGSSNGKANMRLVIAYSTFIIHVLHVLFRGKWDAISMLDNDDDWITTPRFAECASHAIAASEAVSDILSLDPELTFMPYLFGIYLLHGSFILLLFADRMPQLGPNQSVEQACETIIRAHEVCVVTLSTEFQVCRTATILPSHQLTCCRETSAELYAQLSTAFAVGVRLDVRSIGSPDDKSSPSTAGPAEPRVSLSETRALSLDLGRIHLGFALGVSALDLHVTQGLRVVVLTWCLAYMTCMAGGFPCGETTWTRRFFKSFIQAISVY